MNPFLEAILNGLPAPLLILSVSAFRRDLRRRRVDMTTVIAFAVYGALASNLAVLLRTSLANSYDETFLRFDRMLGFNPIAFADGAAKHWFLMIVLVVAYCFLPLAIALAWVLEQDLQMRRAVLLSGCLCFLFYALYPAVGPGYYDWFRHSHKPLAPDNCMPSMHLTWALLIAVNARSLKLRVGLWIYAAIMVLATLALRQHYLVDLIAAVPYTFAVQWLASVSPQFSNVNAPPPEAAAPTVMLND